MDRAEIQEMVWGLIWLGIEPDDIGYFVNAAMR